MVGVPFGTQEVPPRGLFYELSHHINTKFTANASMDASHQAIAGAFSDKLTSMGVVRRVARGRHVECNAAASFCVATIADMKTGGQNAHIGKDPLFLHQPEAILSKLYAGGYTAVADASKFFH
jgi:hypothetical protein